MPPSVPPPHPEGRPPGWGRFAPSPTGDLHLGNLRTAAVAWLAARATGRRFLVRMEDLDRVNSSVEWERIQLDSLAALGIDWEGPVVRQSERFHVYDEAIDRLDAAGLVYPCFCTRREIAEAASAPHLPPGHYPGTCRSLTAAEREERAGTRPPALRLRVEPPGSVEVVSDVLVGRVEAAVDDVVLRRNDGVPAYNLAVVIDDALQRVDQVVRADDLLSSTPRQVWLLRRLVEHAPTLGGQRLAAPPAIESSAADDPALELAAGSRPGSAAEIPEYLHVPLVVGADGERLAKRHGAVTLPQLVDAGVELTDVVTWVARSLDLAASTERVHSVDALLDRFDPLAIPRDAVTCPF